MEEAQKDPWLEDKLAVRRWDDLAKDPEMITPPLSHFEDMTVRSLVKSRSQIGSFQDRWKSRTRPFPNNGATSTVLISP